MGSILTIIVVAGGLLARQGDNEAVAGERLAKIHKAFELYVGDYDGLYPPMSSPESQSPRTRWADLVLPYTSKVETFTSPHAPQDMVTRTFAHLASSPGSAKWGGFGYNYQYLGNSRSVEGNPRLPFGRDSATLSAPGQTVLVAETFGVRFDDGKLSTGVYVVDPPRTSERGSGRTSGFYAVGEACGTGPLGCRALPAEWIPGRVILVTADGSLPKISRARLDDLNGDGTLDNGWWNGLADPVKR